MVCHYILQYSYIMKEDGIFNYLEMDVFADFGGIFDSIVNFNAETSEIEVFGKLETYGTVYWHYPMRCWDARYTLQSRKVLNCEDPAFRSLADTFYTLYALPYSSISHSFSANG